MRYKIKLTESIELVVEGKDEEEIEDFMRCTTIREIRKVNPDITVNYKNEIIEKTVMPKDIDLDDVDEIPPWEE